MISRKLTLSPDSGGVFPDSNYHHRIAPCFFSMELSNSSPTIAPENIHFFDIAQHSHPGTPFEPVEIVGMKLRSSQLSSTKAGKYKQMGQNPKVLLIYSTIIK